jgi:hypothetical protein
MCPYIGLTRESAKNIMWPILQEIDEKYKIGARFTPSSLTVTIPKLGDGKIQLFGADMKNFIRRLRGNKFPGIGVDEGQEFGTHLEHIVQDVLEACIADFEDGWLALTGTPGPVPVGFFYDVTELGKFGYSRHRWSVLDNPYMPGAKQFIADLKAKKGWDDNHPTLQREWRGLWVVDMDALVFKYDAEKNHYDSLPKLQGKWEYVIGVDIGFDDCDAIAVLAWNSSSPDVYLVEEFTMPHQDITDLANQIKKRIKKYNPLKTVIDAGALGKKITEELIKRHGIALHAAEKTRKFEFIELLNDALRTGRFFAKKQGQFAQDTQRVKWDQDASDLKVSDNFHSDICDSVLYAYREALHWLHEPEPEPPPKPQTPEWYQQQEDEMKERAREMVRRKKDSDSDPWGW